MIFLKAELNHILINYNKAAMISYIAAHPGMFDEMVELATSDKQPFSWKAAWLLHNCIEENDRRLQKHTISIINSIPSKEDGHQRELLITISKMKLTEEEEGPLFSICADIWETVQKKPSVRFNALKIIISLAKKYPGLMNEISFLTEDQYLATLPPVIRKAALKIKISTNLANNA